MITLWRLLVWKYIARAGEGKKKKKENVNSLESTLPGYTDKHTGLHLVKGKARGSQAYKMR